MGFKAKEDFFSTSLGKEFGECTHDDVVRNALPKLGTLQNPQFLEKVFQQMRIDFDRLEKLGTLSGCSVRCNPFKQKNTYVISTARTADLEGSSTRRPSFEGSFLPTTTAAPVFVWHIIYLTMRFIFNI